MTRRDVRLAMIGPCFALVLLTVAGCGSDDTSAQTGAARSACDAIFKLRNGGVGTVEEGVQQAELAEVAAGIAAGFDAHFAALRDHAENIRVGLTEADGTTPVAPGQFDTAAVSAEIEAAAQECVSLEDQGWV